MAYVRYQTPSCAAYAKDKLSGFEYPTGQHIVVRYPEQGSVLDLVDLDDELDELMLMLMINWMMNWIKKVDDNDLMDWLMLLNGLILMLMMQWLMLMNDDELDDADDEYVDVTEMEWRAQ